MLRVHLDKALLFSPPPRRASPPSRKPTTRASLAEYKVRQAGFADLPAAATIMADSFPRQGLQLGRRPQTQSDWEAQLSKALKSKIEARREARLELLSQQAWLMKAQLLALELKRPLVPKSYPETAEMRANRSRWRRQRSFTCIIAEERSTRAVVAAAVLSLARPEAALPPPFPTFKPLKAYVSNVAVAEAHRRRGLATLLLRKAERVAAVWGYDSLHLHVDRGNIPAERLYARTGYTCSLEHEQGREEGSVGVLNFLSGVGSGSRRLLLRKQLRVWRGGTARSREEESAVVVGGTRGDDGVFVWHMESMEDEQI
jgi:ribosomal protein S18 acetylase RimI-like enzyme